MLHSTYPMSLWMLFFLFRLLRFGNRSLNFTFFLPLQERQNLGGLVVLVTCRPYMSSLYICYQTKYLNKQSLFWNLCVLLTYIFLLLRIVKFYTYNYTPIILPLYTIDPFASNQMECWSGLVGILNAAAVNLTIFSQICYRYLAAGSRWRQRVRKWRQCAETLRSLVSGGRDTGRSSLIRATSSYRRGSPFSSV